VASRSHVFLNLHLHECLGKHPHALIEEAGVLFDHRLA
jgi:hypothetical protein